MAAAYNSSMHILRRILKYTPAVVMGLLVVAWVVGWFGESSFATNVRSYDVICMSWAGTLLLGFDHDLAVQVTYFDYQGFAWDQLLGRVYVERFEFGCLVQVPYPLILTVLLPVTIGPFIVFRFRLWHYLAFTALVALELAYYLRWQE
jgi:hypothetical protein